MSGMATEAMRPSNLGEQYPICQQYQGVPQQNMTYRSTPTEEQEKKMAYYADESVKAQQAVIFLKAHPEFDEFIRLIRSGAIGI